MGVLQSEYASQARAAARVEGDVIDLSYIKPSLRSGHASAPVRSIRTSLGALTSLTSRAERSRFRKRGRRRRCGPGFQ